MEQQQQPHRSALQRFQAFFGGGKKSPANTAASAAAAHPRVDVTRVKEGVRVEGVSLRYIVDLASKYPETTTVTAFVQQEIKPQTVTKKEAYVDMLARENPSTVRPTAQYFVSYVWAYPLKEVVDALANALLTKTGEKDVFVWMDAFSVNQHQVENKKATPEQLQQTFGESLNAIGKMAMVLVNWQDPSYAKRIWCVFEAYMSKISGIEVVLAMSLAEEKSLVDAMIGNKVDVDFLNTLFGSVNVEKATATILEDQNAILSLIRTFGVAEVNAVVLGNLKQWIVLGGELALNGLDADSWQAGHVCMARYAVHDALGEFDAALEWVDKSLVIYTKVYGLEHSETATTLNNRAECMRSLGRFDEALPLYDQAAAISLKVYGPDHPDYAIKLNNRAMCLSSLGRFDEALPVYDQAAAISLKVYGPDHPDYAIKLNNRAMCLKSLGRFDEALPMYDQAINIWTKALGPDHPQVATGLNNRAGCLDSLGRFDEALPIYDKVEKILRMTVGDNHPNVASTLNNRAVCLWQMDRRDEAKSVGKQALDIFERVLGYDHPNTVTLRESWGGG